MLNKYFKVGFVKEIRANKIIIQLYETNNSFVYFYNGKEYAGISIGGYIGIINGPHTVVAQVDKEFLEDVYEDVHNQSFERERYVRLAEATVVGYFDIQENKYIPGLKILPMIYNEAILLSQAEVLKILSHSGIGKKTESKEDEKKDKEKIKESDSDYPIVGNLVFHDIPFYLNWEKLFNTHIGIFGNTGSGKSNTLAKLYTELFNMRNSKLPGIKNSQFVVLDFNGEYVGEGSFRVGMLEKDIIKLSTSKQTLSDKNRLKISKKDFLNTETLSILFSATEKTQKPFIENAISFYKKDYTEELSTHQASKQGNDNEQEKFSRLIKKISSAYKNVLQVRNPQSVILFNKILTVFYENDHRYKEKNKDVGYINWFNSKFEGQHFLNLEWHSQQEKWYFHTTKLFIDNLSLDSKENFNNGKFYVDIAEGENIEKLKRACLKALQNDDANLISSFQKFDIFDEMLISFYIRLIYEMYGGTSHYEYISPLLSRIESRTPMLRKVLKVVEDDSKGQDHKFLQIISLKDCNMEMKKVIPLLLAKSIYKKQKDKVKEEKVFSITQLIIDEAHNILSAESTRETTQWKDYRLETFEELIKEGRKFGFYLTISSQRPSDISETIISQIHNYFIHRLVNENDLRIIANSISTLDTQSRHSIPFLAPGQCIVTGTSYYTPILVYMDQLDEEERPQSDDVDLKTIWSLKMIENKEEKGEDVANET